MSGDNTVRGSIESEKDLFDQLGTDGIGLIARTDACLVLKTLRTLQGEEDSVLVDEIVAELSDYSWMKKDCDSRVNAALDLLGRYYSVNHLNGEYFFTN